MKVQTWASWDPDIKKSPTSWTAYNNVKHHRDEQFADANQGNTLASFCGLMVLLLYY